MWLWIFQGLKAPQWKGKRQDNNLFFVNRKHDMFQPSLMDIMFTGSAFCDSAARLTLMNYECSLEMGELHSDMKISPSSTLQTSTLHTQ